MEAAVVVAIFVPICVSLIIVFVSAGKQWKEAEAKARESRMAEHRMNARLLRLDI